MTIREQITLEKITAKEFTDLERATKTSGFYPRKAHIFAKLSSPNFESFNNFFEELSKPEDKKYLCGIHVPELCSRNSSRIMVKAWKEDGISLNPEIIAEAEKSNNLIIEYHVFLKDRGGKQFIVRDALKFARTNEGLFCVSGVIDKASLENYGANNFFMGNYLKICCILEEGNKYGYQEHV